MPPPHSMIQHYVISLILLLLAIARGELYSDLTNFDDVEMRNHLEMERHFLTKNNTRIIAQTGGRAILPCDVKVINAATVSWIRDADFHLLTVGLTTYSSDDRFQIEHGRHMGNWQLSIKNVGSRDAGLYRCQLSVHPVEAIYIELIVIEAVSEIVGAPDLHIDEGSTLRLECRLKSATEPPVFVFWYHGTKMINYDTANGFSVTNPPSSRSLLLEENTLYKDEVSSLEVAAEFTSASISFLTIENVNFRHAGNYSCTPSNARLSSIIVHVLKDDKPAAMQHSNSSSLDAAKANSSNCVYKLFRLIILISLIHSWKLYS